MPGTTRQPHLVIVDTQLRTPLSAQLLQVAQRRVLIASVAQADTGWQQRAVALQQAGAELLQLPADPAGRPDLVALLRELGRLEVNELHVESGAQLAGALLQQGLVNELIAYVAPVLLGPGQPLAVLPPLERVADAVRWQLHALQAVGDDVRLQLRPA